MSKLGEVIAREEGFGIPGTIPTTHNNPGDLRHSPHSFHSDDAPNAIGTIENPVLGWEDLERQLGIDAGRGMTIEQLIFSYSPPGDKNDPEAYTEYVCAHVPCLRTDLVSAVLLIPGEHVDE